MNSRTKIFIKEHLTDDVNSLALQSARYVDIDMTLALKQISGRQKIKNKISIFYDNDDLLYPQLLSVEQSSSELTANYKASLFNGKTFIDMTGGFGIDSFFFSKKFSDCTYVERQSELCEIVKHNFKSLNANNITVVNDDCEKYLSKVKAADLIYLDPARRDATGKKVVFLHDCTPNVIDLKDELLMRASKVIIKLSPMLDISKALTDLPKTSEVHVVSVENECKEVLLILSNGNSNHVKYITANLYKNQIIQSFSFQETAETNAQSTFTSKVEKYLYEPNSSVLKAGAFKLISEKFGTKKLHKNTHLYTSDQLIEDFPGRIFQIESVYGSSKKELKKLYNEVKKANITTRNYPLTVKELRKKTKITDGGDIYLFACRIGNDENIIIRCIKA